MGYGTAAAFAIGGAVAAGIIVIGAKKLARSDKPLQPEPRKFESPEVALRQLNKEVETLWKKIAKDDDGKYVQAEGVLIEDLKKVREELKQISADLFAIDDIKDDNLRAETSRIRPGKMELEDAIDSILKRQTPQPVKGLFTFD